MLERNQTQLRGIVANLAKDRRATLLEDLAALQDAGFIDGGREVMCRDGYDAGTVECDTPPTLTYAGRQEIERLKATKEGTE